MADPQALRCPGCAGAMGRAEEVPHPDGRLFLEFYACPDAACARKVALWWEASGAPVSEAQQGWVEREIARRGSFFPSDYR